MENITLALIITIIVMVLAIIGWWTLEKIIDALDALSGENK